MHRRCVRTLNNIGLSHHRYPLTTGTRRRQHTASDPPLAPRKLTNEEHELALRVTEELVDRAAAGPVKGWTAKKTLRGEEKRLVQSIRNADQYKQFPSKEKTRFGALSEPEQDDDEVLPVFTSDLVEPGTFMEIRRNDMAMHGVALGETIHDHRSYIVTLVSTGEIWTHKIEDVAFVIPELVSSDLAARCGDAESTRTYKEVMARVEVLRRIREIEKQVEHAYNIVGHRIHTVYPLVKAVDPNQWTKVTVAQAVKLLRPIVKPSPVVTFAVHKHLMHRNQYFVPDYFLYRTNRVFDVRPESHVEIIQSVTKMSRMKDGPIEAFSAKVRQVTASNRQRALDSQGEYPSQQQIDGSVFTPDDITIIDFLRHSLRARQSVQPDPYELGVAAIVKKLDAYPGTVDSSVVFQVLVDIGVIPPWQDLSSYSFAFSLRKYPEGTTAAVKSGDDSVEKAAASRPATHSVPEGVYRHDFGDMPVYVVDDISAQELDDGVSVESIPSEPGSEWIHVHIADPTTVISSKSRLSRLARDRSETVYGLHETWPMLPPSVVHNGLTLGSSLDKGLSQEVLTFSVKIDREGEIVDYKIRLGLVKNVKILDYGGIDLALGVESPEACYPFGNQDSTPARSLDLCQSELHDLRLLHNVADRLVKARLRLPTFVQAPSTLSISLSSKPPEALPHDLTKTNLFRGFPDVVYKSMSAKASDYGARRMISEFMKAACRVASRFCLDHNIPVLRRTSQRILTHSEADFEKLLSKRDSDGYVDYLEPLRMGAFTPPAGYMLEPRMHWSLGVPEGEGYVRVTSPLRRYSDLVSHWQIKHALLGSQAKPPFSEDVLRDYGKHASVKERHRKRFMQDHEKYWALLFIKRWMQNSSRTNNDLDPLNQLSCVSISAPELNHKTKEFECTVRLQALGFNATLVGMDAQGDISVGTEVPIRVDSILLGNKPRMMVVRR